MSFDFRSFLGQSFDGSHQSVSELLDQMDGLGIEHCLVCPFKPVTYNLDQANRDLAVIVQNHRDRLLGAARIDPWQPDAPDVLRRAFETGGLRVLYLNPWEEHFCVDLARLDPLMEIARQFQYPVMVATGYPWLSEALQVCRLAQRWPEIPLVMTNGGQINITGLGQADATLAMRSAPNLYLDTAGVYRQDFIEETVEAFGSQRVLFASSSPYFDPRYEIRRAQLAKVSEIGRQAMLAGNAQRLLGIVG